MEGNCRVICGISIGYRCASSWVELIPIWIGIKCHVLGDVFPGVIAVFVIIVFLVVVEHVRPIITTTAAIDICVDSYDDGRNRVYAGQRSRAGSPTTVRETRT